MGTEKFSPYDQPFLVKLGAGDKKSVVDSEKTEERLTSGGLPDGPETLRPPAWVQVPQE